MKNTILNELKMMFGFRTARINRMRYISYCGFFFAVYFLISLTLVSFLPASVALPSLKLDDFIHNIGFTFLAIMLLMLVILSVFPIWWATRRLHDMNLSAKWFFLWLVFPFVAGMQKIFAFADLQGMLWLFGIGTILHLLITILLMSVPGTRRKNRFGEVPPKNTYINYVFFVLFFVFIVLAPAWKAMQVKKRITESTQQNAVQMQDKEKGHPFRTQ
jgi:uncharacterized membrane protein YhaH (DUF805 family)